MFDIDNITYNACTKQYICRCQCETQQDAEYICAKYISVARSFDSTGALYRKDVIVIIETSERHTTVSIAQYINANHFMPPLDVYIFYGSNRHGLSDRWCIGFDYPCTKDFIVRLSSVYFSVDADNNPQYWETADGRSYSVILTIAVSKTEQPQEWNQRVQRCLKAIEIATYRKLNLHDDR